MTSAGTNIGLFTGLNNLNIGPSSIDFNSSQIVPLNKCPTTSKNCSQSCINKVVETTFIPASPGLSGQFIGVTAGRVVVPNNDNSRINLRKKICCGCK